MQPMPNGNGTNQLSSPSSGDVCKPAEVVGHLLIVRPVEFLSDFVTAYGAADTVRVDICDLSAADDRGQPGVVFRDALWFNKMLVSGLRRQIGELVLGKMAMGIARAGQSAPLNLIDMMGDPGAVAAAQAWLNAHPEFSAGHATSSTPATAPGTTAPQSTQTPYNPAAQQYTPPQPTAPPPWAVSNAPIQSPSAPPQYANYTPPQPASAPRPAVNPNADAWGNLSEEQRQALAALGFQPTT